MGGAPSERKRLDSIDLLRGGVMIVMALDHVRDLFSNVHGGHFVPTDMARTWPALFFTRWITHFCAPVFVFLAGTGARLQSARKSKRELSWFLVTRGLWIIFLEITWVHVTMTFDIGFHFTPMQVMWAIGCGMIALAGLIWLPTWLVGAIGIVLCAGHNLLQFGPNQPVPLIWRILEARGPLELDSSHLIMFGYPLLAWIGVMASGYAFGDLVRLEQTQRRRAFFWLGATLVVLFVIIRGINRYGDPNPWSSQKNTLFTVMSFLNVWKYPPSLDYLLMTLGASILLLAFLDRLRVSPRNFVVVFGRVPMFYYLAHFPLRDLLAWLLFYFQIGPRVFGIRSLRDLPDGMGYSLIGVYLSWLAVVLLLYYPCRRYAEYKRAHPKKAWLSYL